MKKLLVVLLLLFLCVSCKTTRTVYVPVDKIKTEYIKQIDSVYVQDSIYYWVHTKNDTVYSEKKIYKLKEVTKKDTIILRDSIPYPIEVEKVVVTNELYWWQKALAWIGALTLIVFVIQVFKKFKL